MKKLLLISALLFSGGVWAGAYDMNSFGQMPHQRIMELNVEECNIEAHASGDDNYTQKCIDDQKLAFKKLITIYNDKAITAPSWSICVGQSKSGYSYNYVIMYACMKVVKDICPEKQDGSWENPNVCLRSMESGAWINNPKIYQPYKSSKKTLDLSSDDQAP